MTHHRTPADPGWRTLLIRFLPRVFLPAGPRLLKRGEDQPPILAIRAVFVTFAAAMLSFVVVLQFQFPLTSPGDVPAVVYVLLGAGALAVRFVPVAARRLLTTFREPGGLIRHYGTSFFLGIALSELSALLGFVAAFLAEAVWPYLVGMSVALVGFFLVAPTSSRIRRLDESLSASGCTESLRTMLYTPTSSDPPPDPDS